MLAARAPPPARRLQRAMQRSVSRRFTLAAVPLESRAYWLGEDVFATPADPQGQPFLLYASAGASLVLEAGGVTGADGPPLPLRVDNDGLPTAVRAKFPHLAELTCLQLDAPPEARRLLLKSQLLLCCGDDATGVQTAGALDALFAYDGPLGAQLEGGIVTLHLWAPTAQRVSVLVHAAPRGGPPPQEVLLAEGERGVWTARGPWAGLWLSYRVLAFSPHTGRVEERLTTCPYARALAANGQRFQAVDLEEARLAPPGWAARDAARPPLAHACDAVLYELHVRDFSVADASVPPPLRGTFRALALADTAGGRHLQALAAAGVTHVHLLPVFDFGSVDELRASWREPAGPGGAALDSLAPDGEEQQAAVAAVADCDGFNWGYDPVHWGVPDGSYCTQPDGASRTLELREAVAGLHARGLRVVLDVVYNHVYGGPLCDAVVPGYYLRRDEAGRVHASTCMNNTASEHAMVERLIVDDALHWAAAYAVDGFRFDLMGHLMLRTLRRLRAALDAAGRPDVLLYGEGWDYGEVENGRVGENAGQLRLAGSAVGSFNDRLREGAMGGGPFSDPRLQGLLTGLGTQPWPPGQGAEQGGAAEQAAALRRSTLRVLAGVAGNLSDYELPTRPPVRGWDAGGAASACAYAAQPCETVNYVSAHDNETLFDLCALKLPPRAGAARRAAAARLAQRLVAWSCGIPFFHAGDELLRSKSLDRDSYNSGDHYNAVDWTGQRSGWGVGLPPAAKNRDSWHLMRPLLADPDGAPTPALARAQLDAFLAALRVRASSPLFRLRTCADVLARLHVHSLAEGAPAGLLAWELCDGDGDTLPRLDAAFSALLVVLNCAPDAAALRVEALAGRAWCTHPLLLRDGPQPEASVDATGMLSVHPLAATVLCVQR